MDEEIERERWVDTGGPGQGERGREERKRRKGNEQDEKINQEAESGLSKTLIHTLPASWENWEGRPSRFMDSPPQASNMCYDNQKKAQS